MDLLRFGRGIRALRLRRRWRQVDLAAAAGVSQSTIVTIELGRGRRTAIETVERVAAALDARVDLRLNWNGEALDRLLDHDHAALVERVAAWLTAAGWEVRTEISFWIRGERGAVDLVGWHAETRTILVIEVKSVVPDVRATLFTLDRKARLGREIAASLGWSATSVARLLVMGENRTARRRIEEHRATFAAPFPDRVVEVRRFVGRPVAEYELRGLIFLSGSSRATSRHRQPRQSRRTFQLEVPFRPAAVRYSPGNLVARSR